MVRSLYPKTGIAHPHMIPRLNIYKTRLRLP